MPFVRRLSTLRDPRSHSPRPQVSYLLKERYEETHSRDLAAARPVGIDEALGASAGTADVKVLYGDAKELGGWRGSQIPRPSPT